MCGSVGVRAVDGRYDVELRYTRGAAVTQILDGIAEIARQ